MNIKEILRKGNEILQKNNIEDSLLKSRMLLSNLLNKNKEFLIIHDNEIIPREFEIKYFEYIEKLVTGIPIQYITHNQEFMGLNFFVNENVLIPQPDTEILVEEIISKINYNDEILDLCTGSGAIGISIAKLCKDKDLNIYLSDISKEALNVAKENSLKNEVNVNFVQSDLFENINQKFNLIVSNPPYIETDCIKELSLEVQNEPNIALDGGKDGLIFYRKIAKEAKNYLKEKGILGLEIGYNQNDIVIEILQKEGYIDIYSKKDYGNNDRIIICKRGK